MKNNSDNGRNNSQSWLFHPSSNAITCCYPALKNYVLEFGFVSLAKWNGGGGKGREKSPRKGKRDSSARSLPWVTPTSDLQMTLNASLHFTLPITYFLKQFPGGFGPLSSCGPLTLYETLTVQWSSTYYKDLDGSFLPISQRELPRWMLTRICKLNNLCGISFL